MSMNKNMKLMVNFFGGKLLWKMIALTCIIRMHAFGAGLCELTFQIPCVAEPSGMLPEARRRDHARRQDFVAAHIREMIDNAFTEFKTENQTNFSGKWDVCPNIQTLRVLDVTNRVNMDYRYNSITLSLNRKNGELMIDIPFTGKPKEYSFEANRLTMWILPLLRKHIDRVFQQSGADARWKDIKVERGRRPIVWFNQGAMPRRFDGQNVCRVLRGNGDDAPEEKDETPGGDSGDMPAPASKAANILLVDVSKLLGQTPGANDGMRAVAQGQTPGGPVWPQAPLQAPRSAPRVSFAQEKEVDMVTPGGPSKSKKLLKQKKGYNIWNKPKSKASQRSLVGGGLGEFRIKKSGKNRGVIVELATEAPRGSSANPAARVKLSFDDKMKMVTANNDDSERRQERSARNMKKIAEQNRRLKDTNARILAQLSSDF